MILSFKPQFVDKILNGSKIHTIRKRSNRWKKGNKIHFANNIRTKNYKQFYEGVCTKVSYVLVDHKRKIVWVDGYPLRNHWLDIFIKNDGFDTHEEFWQWFKEDFYGILIQWTDFQYPKLNIITANTQNQE